MVRLDFHDEKGPAVVETECTQTTIDYRTG